MFFFVFLNTIFWSLFSLLVLLTNFCFVCINFLFIPLIFISFILFFIEISSYFQFFKFSFFFSLKIRSVLFLIQLNFTVISLTLSFFIFFWNFCLIFSLLTYLFYFIYLFFLSLVHLILTTRLFNLLPLKKKKKKKSQRSLFPPHTVPFFFHFLQLLDFTFFPEKWHQVAIEGSDLYVIMFTGLLPKSALQRSLVPLTCLRNYR